MSNTNMKSFHKRVGRIDELHHKLEREGSVTSTDKDGLIVARARRVAPRFPWKGVAISFAIFFVFKGFLLVHLGQATYDGRVGKLQDGTVVEQAGAYAMSADPLTRWIAAQIQSVLP